MSAPTNALAKRPCMALARPLVPLFAPWRGRLREIFALFIGQQLARQALRRYARAYGLLDHDPSDAAELFEEAQGYKLFKETQARIDRALTGGSIGPLAALLVALFVSACGAEPSPPDPRPIMQAPLHDMSASVRRAELFDYDAMAERIKHAAERDDARNVERHCGKNVGADRIDVPRGRAPAASSPEIGGNPP